MRNHRVLLCILLLMAACAVTFVLPAPAAEKQTKAEKQAAKAKAKAEKPKAKRTNVDTAGPAPQAALSARVSSEDPRLQRDYPAMCLDDSGAPWIAYIEHDGKADVLKLARRTKTGLETIATVSTPGIVHQPAIARDGTGGIWSVWGQLGADDVVHLHARRWADGKLGDDVVLAQSSAGSDTFADARADAAGRVWVTWQSMRRGQGDIYTRWLDPRKNEWSKEIAVSKPEGGNWEPRLAFDGRDGAWIAFDSSRGGEFNIYLAHVSLEGAVTEKQITSTPDYEARASIIGDGNGKGLWIASERGRREWGLANRGHESETGLNGEKRIMFGYYDIAAGSFTEVPLLQGGKPGARRTDSVNLPGVGVDAAGNPWLAYRGFGALHWNLDLVRYDAGRKVWSKPVETPDSAFGQDRRAAWELDRAGKLWLAWPADRREKKECAVAAVFLAQVDSASASQDAGPPVKVTLLPPNAPYLHEPTDRPRTEHHTWTIGGKTYRVCFGDLHRHTEFSNCRTAFDGCVLEHMRYAVDMAALDFVGTSDHTDIAKKYDPYEWWQTQRLVDVFNVPHQFTPLYAYEREQKWPWGHRNIAFAQRGGPIVYISRETYRNSQWQSLYPIGEGEPQITPMELWSILRAYGKPVTAISHTGATGMGTDWDKYDHIDHQVENVVEIFQGARTSYEGQNLPQPTVGLRVGQRYGTPPATNSVPPEPIDTFGQYNNGVYQRSLADGRQLGVFASSDHISAHCAYGGVYVEEQTRGSLVAGLNARRTTAGTAKVFVEFSCNGEPMGTLFTADRNPELTLAVFGTAPVSRVTVVRNEQDFKVFTPNAVEFKQTFTDTAPLPGENRYYLRIEQTDGNMAWASPVWVTVKK